MTALPDDVRRARANAAARHADSLAGASACAIAKSGGTHPAGKFWEGQTSALGELQRSGGDIAVTARRLAAQWRTRPIPGVAAEADAYRAGGLEALMRFAAREAPEAEG